MKIVFNQMVNMRKTILLLLASSFMLGACGDDDGSSTPGTPDASPPVNNVDAAPAEPDPIDAGMIDAAPVDSDAGSSCVASAILPASYAPNDKVSDGAVEVVDGITRIDATAGGFLNVQENPFIYLSFGTDAIEKVEITDVDSFDDASWDFAVKRTAWRANSGDSGSGGVTVAMVTASFDEVTDIPAEDAFETSEWASDSCEYVGSGLLGEPGPAFAAWYDYDTTTNLVSPKVDTVFIVSRADGAAFKLKITNYRRDDVSGQYEVEWAAL